MHRIWRCLACLSALATVACLVPAAMGQAPQPQQQPQDRASLLKKYEQYLGQQQPKNTGAVGDPRELDGPAKPLIRPNRPEYFSAQPGEHPLMPALRWAYDRADVVTKIHDYSATLSKRERVGGKLRDYEHAYVKIRHQPFSVYMYFLDPSELKGQEVIYIHGQNNGKIWAHSTGVKDRLVGTVSLAPDGVIAMHGQRYPITEIGIYNLVCRLVEVGQEDIKYGECDVQWIPGVKVDDRVCTCIQVTHPIPRRNFFFHIARIYIDQQLNLPIRYEGYTWPQKQGGQPELMEEYTYRNLKINNGFTDADFDIRNPNYRFR